MRSLLRSVGARRGVVVLVVAATAVLAVSGASGQPGSDALVTVGSPGGSFSQNKQNEPALAVDASHPDILVAGANDNIDEELCNAGDDTTCPFTAGVGGSGVYFSFDSGHTWTQPTYTGYSARGCTGEVGPGPDCTPDPEGPIGTLPWYYENGLVSDGDPALAFGPRPGPDGFSWGNGSRLYYANLTSNFPVAKRPEQTFKGAEAIYVSRTDDVNAAAAGTKSAWMQPVKVSKQSSGTFADKEQIWADNAASSPYFGNVYICYAKFVGNSAPMEVAVSRDGGDSWAESKVSPAHNVAPSQWGQSGCTVRTDSRGMVYVFWEQFQNPTKFFPPVGTHFLITSSDGGATWTKPRAIGKAWDACSAFDPVLARCVEDGVAGARSDLSAAPSADIANGAPTGVDATDEIVVAWADAREGVNDEHVLVRYSTDRGRSFSAPQAVESAGDRPYYAAPAISPDGQDVYVVYNAFTTPYQETTSTPRGLVGVVKHAPVSTSGALGAFSEAHRGATGDPRTSSQNNLVAEFLGDYVYAVATRSYGAGVWNDVRDGPDCPAIDAWRQSLEDGTGGVARPAPQQDCPLGWGNTDIRAWTGAP